MESGLDIFGTRMRVREKECYSRSPSQTTLIFHANQLEKSKSLPSASSKRIPLVRQRSIKALNAFDALPSRVRVVMTVDSKNRPFKFLPIKICTEMSRGKFFLVMTPKLDASSLAFFGTLGGMNKKNEQRWRCRSEGWGLDSNPLG